MRALDIGATAMMAQQTYIDVTADNIAHLNTTGHKRSRAEFNDLLYQDRLRVGAASSDQGTIRPTGVRLGAGVAIDAVYRIHEQGTIEITENALDLALSGRGYFQIELPNGQIGYTRAGNFQLSPDSEIVTSDGYLLVGPGAVPPNTRQISVNESGEIFALVDGDVDPVNVGQIELAVFANDPGLEAIGDNLYLETPASGNAVNGFAQTPGFGKIRQGMLERSNVNAVTEITNLIKGQRAYEMGSKVITTADEMMRTANNVR